MDLELDDVAIRVLGALMEKSLATPDYYPMSLSGLSAACNQKSSRDPVMSLSEGQVQDALDGLLRLHLVRERSQAGARVTKFAHRLDDELGLSFGFNASQVALLALLMLRGPQTPGELRTRSARLHSFDDVPQVERELHELATAERGPYVRRLAREPGRREARYVQLFGAAGESGPEHDDDVYEREAARFAAANRSSAPASHGDLVLRVEALEEEVRSLREAVERLSTQRG